MGFPILRTSNLRTATWCNLGPREARANPILAMCSICRCLHCGSHMTTTRTPKKCSAVTIMAAPTMWDAEREITYRTIRRREGQWRQDKRDSASIASLAGCLARTSKSLSISKGGNARRAPAGHLAPIVANFWPLVNLWSQTSEAHLREGAYTCGRSPQCGGDTSSSESWESRAAGDIGHHGESIECSARYCAALSLAKSVRI